MPPTTIRTAPSLDAFTALADHQAQTPTTFYGAKPVLHYHATGTRALASRDQLSKLPIFPSGADDQSESRLTETEAEAGAPERLVVEVVDAFISSEYVLCGPPSSMFHFPISTLLIPVHCVAFPLGVS
jgi:chloride channel, nucleotide-sensitive, 1A